MKFKFCLLTLFVFTLTFLACNKDDGGSSPIVENDRDEQQAIDDALIVEYLETHYYNSGMFDSNMNPKINNLVITELPEDGILPDPDNNTLLIDAVETHTITYKETLYDYYVLRLNQGGGIESPAFTDKIRLNYSGNFLDEEVFDSTASSTEFDISSLVVGWQRVLPQFNIAENFAINGDGTVTYTNHGVGVMFLPSGLGYYAQAVSAVPAYSNLIFKFELYQSEQNDHDADGIPSYLEDIDGDLDIYSDDTDDDQFSNFIDVDDDGDGTITKDEIIETTYNEPTRQAILDLPLASNEVLIKIVEVEDEEGMISYDGYTVTFPDTNGNGIPNYLDEDESESFD